MSDSYLDAIQRSKELIRTYMNYLSEQSEIPLDDVDIKTIDKTASVMQKLFKLLDDVAAIETKYEKHENTEDKEIQIEDVHAVLSLCREWGVLHDNYETDAEAIYKKIKTQDKEIRLK